MANTTQYKESAPPEELKDYIKFFWSFEHKEEDFDFIVLPDACFDLVLDFEYGELKNVFLTGVWTKPQIVTVTRGTTLLAVRFKILAAEILFGKEIKSLLNTMTTLPKHFWKCQSMDCSDFDSFCRGMINTSTELVKQSHDTDNRKLKLFDLVYHQHVFRVDKLAEEVYWSSRQINRYFNRQFGFPLKRFIDIVRCLETYEDIVNGNLYPSDSYTDQAHFIREIRKYTDATPRQLYINKNDRFIQLTPLKKD